MDFNQTDVEAKRATQAIFLVCGLAISSWAPMVPLAKQRLGLNDGNLGLLLLLLGLGAIVMMPISGFLSHKFGTRIVILYAGLLAAACLPLLLIMPGIISMGFTLLLFGAGVGTVDVAMNAHGVHVQNRYGKPIMSSLHGLFSVGGLCGSLGLGVLIKLGLEPLLAAVAISILLVLILVWKYRALFTRDLEKEATVQETVQGDLQASQWGWLKPSVIFLGLACFALFLSEGAMLDWSALFLREQRGVGVELAGVGYAAFSIAMAIMRLLGDKLVERLNGKWVVVGGGLLAASGIFMVIGFPWLEATLIGFILLGTGAANIVPVFFSEGGKLKGVPASIAIPAISTMGYAGQLAGPALLGFLAHHFSLSFALAFTGMLILVVALSYALKKT
jgi:predicted MFS family arabinose efflux permease